MKQTELRDGRMSLLKTQTTASFCPNSNCLPLSMVLHPHEGVTDLGVKGRDPKINKTWLNHQQAADEQGSAYREPLWRKSQNPSGNHAGHPSEVPVC